MKTIICDLDGTLANIDHRLHFIKQEKPDWAGFFGAVAQDTPNEWCVELLRAMRAAGHDIVFVSGRNSTARAATVEWLNALGFGGFELLMRDELDYKPDHVIKQGMYRAHLQSRDILFVLDDRKRVVEMWRENGLTVLHCAEGDF